MAGNTVHIAYSVLIFFMIFLSLALPGRAQAGDYYILIVPERSHIPEDEAAKLGARMLLWMQGQGYVETMPSDCVLGKGPGFRFTARANEAQGVPIFPHWAGTQNVPLRTFGMEVKIGKNVFHSGEGGLESAFCPACTQTLLDEEGYDLASAWWDSPPDAPLPCPRCRVGQDISAYGFTPVWGFSSLGFKFWNTGPPSEAFVKRFAEELGEPVRVVQGML